MNTKGKVAIITGGASGLGEACLRNLVSGGVKVAILDIQTEKGEQLVNELGPPVIFCRVDVTSEQSTIEGIRTTMAAFGAIHIAINCAGAGPPTKVLSKKGPHPLDEFNRIVQINLIGTFNVIRLAVEQMVKNERDVNGGKGVVINTSSVAAFDGQIGQAAYSASKAAIVGMTLPIARECAEYGIRITTICPGIFNTPLLNKLPEPVLESLGKMVPFPPRMGLPSEFAALARHIIENPYLNGEAIRLDGAIRMAAK
jgi:3-hydroxyacyl-CoA dehydrogenase / 3-hydroxy-2-methylbutyryl-CoA dehydrogenase